MKLENQVVSLELAKKLKELGVKQESLVGWRLRHITDGNNERLSTEWSLVTDGLEQNWKGEEANSAFTVAELGEVLKTSDYELPQFDGDEWSAGAYFPGDGEADTEADARAKMLIYLMENKVIEA